MHGSAILKTTYITDLLLYYFYILLFPSFSKVKVLKKFFFLLFYFHKNLMERKYMDIFITKENRY